MDISILDTERATKAERLLQEFEAFKYCLADDGYDNLGSKMTFELYKLVKEIELNEHLVEQVGYLYELIYER